MTTYISRNGAKIPSRWKNAKTITIHAKCYQKEYQPLEAVERKLDGLDPEWIVEAKLVKPIMRKQPAIREGKNGTGIILKELCGFCKNRFRSRRQRFQHAKGCVENTTLIANLKFQHR